MGRILSKVLLIAVALTLITSQARAQNASSLPTLYRNGEAVEPGTPAMEPVDGATATEESSSPIASGTVLTTEPSDVEAEVPVIINTPPASTSSAEESAAGVLETPTTDGGLLAMVMNLVWIAGLMIVGGIAFFFLKRRRKSATTADPMPLPVASVADSPSKLREAIAEMKKE